MRYFKTVDENNIIDFGYCGKYIPVGSIEITEEEYAQLKSVIVSKPSDTQVNPTEPVPEQAVVDSIMQEVSSYGY